VQLSRNPQWLRHITYHIFYKTRFITLYFPNMKWCIEKIELNM